MTELEGGDKMQVPDEIDEVYQMGQLQVEATTILISLHNLKIAIKNIENNVKQYQKQTSKFIQSLRKNQKSKSNKKGGGDSDKKDREPTGFYKKTKVRKELADFFRKPDVAIMIDNIMNEEDVKENSTFEPMDEENMINRPSATKIINRYIKERGLQHPTNRQFFTPDDSLKKILAILDKTDKANGGYRCFNLQRYIKHNFLK